MSRNERSAAPEICNCTALRAAARNVTKMYDEALAPLALGLNQYSILARLNRIGPRTIRELAALLVMDRSTLGHLLRPLEKRGFVKLTIAKEDRRNRVLVLTVAGKAMVARAEPFWNEAQARFERSFGIDAALDLRKMLKRAAMADLQSDSGAVPGL